MPTTLIVRFTPGVGASATVLDYEAGEVFRYSILVDRDLSSALADRLVAYATSLGPLSSARVERGPRVARTTASALEASGIKTHLVFYP